jgi:hypothetical protein
VTDVIPILVVAGATEHPELAAAYRRLSLARMPGLARVAVHLEPDVEIQITLDVFDRDTHEPRRIDFQWRSALLDPTVAEGAHLRLRDALIHVWTHEIDECLRRDGVRVRETWHREYDE